MAKCDRLIRQLPLQAAPHACHAHPAAPSRSASFRLVLRDGYVPFWAALDSGAKVSTMKINPNRRPLDPRLCKIGLDSNALDRDGTAKDLLVARFERWLAADKLVVVVGGGVRGEAQHPNTPVEVKAAVLPQIFNLRPGLNTSQQTARQRVVAILQGDAKAGKHAADASHLSEAAETGCSYFITHDKRILGKRDQLADVLPPTLQIVTLN